MNKKKLFVSLLSSALTVFSPISAQVTDDVSNISEDKRPNASSNSKIRKFIKYPLMFLVPSAALVSLICACYKCQNENKTAKKGYLRNDRDLPKLVSKKKKFKNLINQIIDADYDQESKSDKKTFLECYNALRLIKSTEEVNFYKTTRTCQYLGPSELNKDELKNISSSLGFLLGKIGLKKKHFCEAGKPAEIPIEFSVITRPKNTSDEFEKRCSSGELAFYVEINHDKTGMGCNKIKLSFFVSDDNDCITCWTAGLVLGSLDTEELKDSIKKFLDICNGAISYAFSKDQYFGIADDDYLKSARLEKW